MKRILVISLLVNLVLLALVAWPRSRRVILPVRELRGESRTEPEPRRLRPSHEAAPTPAGTPWSKIESLDVQQFIANLRAMGCPEATVRDIVTFRICRAYRERLLNYETDLARRLSDNQNLDRSEWQKLRELNQDLRDEMQSELESALGDEWTVLTSRLTGFPASADGLNQFLSADQRAHVREINRQFRRELEELRQKQQIYGLENEEVTALRDLERRKRDALAVVLSPAELEEYLYRDSPAAEYVRRNLPAARSESEYRTMVKLALEMEMSQTLDSPQRHYGLTGDADTVEADVESQQKRQDYAQRLKELLGEDRIAEQQAAEQVRAEAEAKAKEEQAKQRMQQELMTLAAEAGVNAESATRFFDRLKDSQPILQKKFEEMEKVLSGTPEEKQKQMEAAIKAELSTLAIETMGDKGPAVVERMLKRDK